MAVTLREIARKVGVSQPLVTYALNGKPGVSDAMRQRILETAQEMGYSTQDNRAARALAAQRHGTKVRTGVLALLLPPPTGPANTVQDNPFFMPYFNGVEIEASKRDYDLFVCALRKEGLPRLLRNGGVDGVLGIGVGTCFGELKELEIPSLAIGEVVDGAYNLMPDDASGIQQVVEHLVQRGHRKIAYVGVVARDHRGSPYNRLQSFRNALGASGLKVDERLIESKTTYMESGTGGDLVDALLERRAKFTALVCYNDLFAMGAIDRLQQLGRRVPEDVAVAGFDDYASQVGYRPALTTAGFDRLQMGRCAVEQLCRRLDDKSQESSEPETATFPVQLIQGDTT